jgi:hypothetical protein
MAQGEEKAVIISVRDAQGNDQDITGFSFQGGAGVSVAEDTTYLTTNAGGQLGTSKRLFIQGLSPTATALTVTANGQTSTVPIRVTPVEATVTLSNAAPAANEGLVITLPAGYKFGNGGGANVSGTAGITTSVAPDSSSATVILPPGTTGELTVDSVTTSFIPGVLFSLPTGDSVTVGPATPLAGTDNPATAPALSVPPAGGTTALYDAPDFTANPNRFYRIDFPEAGDYQITTNWTTGSDIDMILCFDAACSDGDGQAATSAHPEVGVYTIAAPVTYYLLINDYAGDAVGTMVSIQIDH